MNEAATELDDRKRRMKRLRRAIVLDYSIWVILVLVVVVLSLLTDSFLSTINLSNIMVHSAVLGVIVIGESLCLLVGKFDLSIGSTVALSGAVAAWLMVSGETQPTSGLEMHPALAIPIVLAVGASVGLFNGFFIAKVGMNPLLTTLATMMAVRGLAQVVTSGESLYGFPDAYRFFGKDSIAGFPVSVAVMLGLLVIFFLVLRHMRIGRHIYIVGGNPGAARACGIPVARVEMFAFMMSGLLAAAGGILLSGRLNSAQTNAATGMELEAISAAVIGGISLAGGRGKLLNVIAGVLVIKCIASGMVLLDVPAFWILFTTGFIIFAAILIDTLKTRLRWDE